MRLFAAIVLLAGFCLRAQEAKVIIVEKPDTAELKAAYREYKAALEHWDKIKLAVAKRYTLENGKVMPGWERIEFSVDFRAMVPVVPEQSRYASSWPCASGNLDLSGATTGAMLLGANSDRAVDVGVDAALKTIEKK